MSKVKPTKPYKPKNAVRIVTAASLFDGHDASINIMRRIIQGSGAEVIHLGHNRSVGEIVNTAIQEDVQAIAMTSYQGGHLEYFKYMFDLLQEKQSGHIKIFAGGGGVILPHEIEELHNYGITRIYSPDDGRSMGLQGMINDLLQKSDFATGKDFDPDLEKIKTKDHRTLARLISAAENYPDSVRKVIDSLSGKTGKKAPVLGITGTGGAGKSSLVDEIVRRYLQDQKDKTIAIVSVDPSKRRTGGALLGDRIRMNAIDSPRVYMRSLATRQSNLSMSKYIKDAEIILQAAGFDLIILETSGIGQSDTEIIDHSDLSLYVMTPEYGAASQLEKIDMLDFADLVALNKFDKRGSLDALRDVKKQYQRNHLLFDKDPGQMPVYGTIASQFSDPGVNELYLAILDKIHEKTGVSFKTNMEKPREMSEKIFIIPPKRVRYLSEIADTVRQYNQWSEEQSLLSHRYQNLKETLDILEKEQPETAGVLREMTEHARQGLDPVVLEVISNWDHKKKLYKDEYYVFKVRDKEIKVATHTKTLSHLKVPKVAMPRFRSWGEIVRWSLRENVPGEFPFAAGVFPFKREEEDPTRMFAGEGGPERTNRRFHYLSLNMPARRLSTAFDSVTLYGEDPHRRPDIYGKVGNSGVSVACLDDAKKLYSGFNLADPRTSVSMTINGPAPTITAFFLNAAIDQQCELYIRENGLEKGVSQKIDAIYKNRKTTRPQY
ncbi:MAG: methylmalonyl-CoA mutase family protein, partial [Bacteroidota bacterium]